MSERGRQAHVSIVTPVYNGGKYLRECIESVLQQSYSNWNYIIVDNCSTDETRAIADHYARRDSRIRVYANERFLPSIDNHNVAYRLIASHSKYCKPLMADDWLFPECLEKMVAVAESSPTVGLVCCYAFDGKDVLWSAPPYPAFCVPGRQVCRESLLGGAYVFGSPSTMLFRAAQVRARDPFLNPTNLHADVEVCFSILSDADFAFVHQVLTMNRIHPESQTSAVQNLESVFIGTMYSFHKFGKNFLTAPEFERRHEELLAHYYALLAKHALRRPGREFWEYQRQKMRLIGSSLKTHRLWSAILWRLLSVVARPWRIGTAFRDRRPPLTRKYS